MLQDESDRQHPHDSPKQEDPLEGRLSRTALAAMFKLVEDPQWTGVTLTATTSCQIIPDVKHTHEREIGTKPGDEPDRRLCILAISPCYFGGKDTPVMSSLNEVNPC
jgi:hypothetical protein